MSGWSGYRLSVLLAIVACFAAPQLSMSSVPQGRPASARPVPIENWAGVSATAPTSYTIALTSSLPSGILAGTPITWTATSNDPTPLVYQFSVGYEGQAPQMVRDFSPKSSILWTPMVEGIYTITVLAKEGYGVPVSLQTSMQFQATHKVIGTASISPTNNPLVALYRAPSCSAGSIAVQFRQTGTDAWTSTNSQPCHPTPPLTRPFYVAGMVAHTTYDMRAVVTSGQVMTASAIQTYTTGSPPASLGIPSVSVPQPPGPTSDITDSLLIHEYTAVSGNAGPMASNIAGQVVWYAYEPDLPGATSRRFEQGGYSYLDANDGTQQPSWGGNNVLREIDLAGNPVRETNIAAINAQLRVLGDLPIYGFNHDYLDLPNGDLAVLAWTTKTITTTPIMGDDLVVLDKNLQVSWVWDSFKFLDPYRGPTLGDTCGRAWHTLSCPVPGGPSTIDWLHINAISWSPQDNDIVLSVRNQDWVIKINYDNGAGDGSVIWRMGPDGDFTLIPASPRDPYPWFSHQHDANLLDGTTLAVFDNGNTRCHMEPQPCHSRGQEYLIDEADRVVTETMSLDLGAFAPSWGVAQRLSNGNFNFDLGGLGSLGHRFGQQAEYQRSGTKVFVGQIQIGEYRAWRLPTMYSTTNLPCPTCTSGY